MNIADIEKEWKQDAPIDITKMDDVSTSVPSLHAKYVSLLSNVKMNTMRVEREFLKIRRIRTAYYNGTLTQPELVHYGWEQYQEKRPLKTVLDELLQTDDVLMDTRMKIEELGIMKEFLESIMKSIHSRTYDVKNIIEWQKYSNGMV